MNRVAGCFLPTVVTVFVFSIAASATEPATQPAVVGRATPSELRPEYGSRGSDCSVTGKPEPIDSNAEFKPPSLYPPPDKLTPSPGNTKYYCQRSHDCRQSVLDETAAGAAHGMHERSHREQPDRTMNLEAGTWDVPDAVSVYNWCRR